jgi:DNA-binding transcriptional regulator LsrR (DeoR family)
MSSRRSSPATPRTSDEVHRRLTRAWSRTMDEQDLTQEAFAARIGCCRDTVKNALAGDRLPKLHFVLNSLLACPNALDELLQLYGLQIIPRSAEASADMQTLSHMGRAMAEFIEALSDGKRTHKETLELAEVLRPLVPRLTQIVHEADGLKEVA